MHNKQKNSPYSKDFKHTYNNINDFMSPQNVPNILRFNVKNNENSPVNKQTSNSNETKKFGVRTLLNMPNDIYSLQKDNRLGKKNITNTIDEQQKQFINDLDNFMKNENLMNEENLIEYNDNKKQSKNIKNSSTSIFSLDSNNEEMKNKNGFIEQTFIGKCRKSSVSSSDENVKKNISCNSKSEIGCNEKQENNTTKINSNTITKSETYVLEPTDNKNNIIIDLANSEASYKSQENKDFDQDTKVINTTDTIFNGQIISETNVLNNEKVEVPDTIIFKENLVKDVIDHIPNTTMTNNTDLKHSQNQIVESQSENIEEKNIEEKKIDIKKYYNIETMSSSKYQIQMNTNQMNNAQTNQTDIMQTSNTEDTFPQLESIDSNTINPTRQTDTNTKVFLDTDTMQKTDGKLGNLNIDQIIVTFRVIGDLKEGTKLKLVSNTHLAEDNSYVSSFSRTWSGQSRELIIGFLEHLLVETKRNIAIILNNIRNNIEYDTNIDVLEKTFEKICVFLHKFDTMRNVYKYDTSSYARLGVIRDNFHTFKGTFFRDIIPKKK